MIYFGFIYCDPLTFCLHLVFDLQYIRALAMLNNHAYVLVDKELTAFYFQFFTKFTTRGQSTFFPQQTIAYVYLHIYLRFTVYTLCI